MRCGKKAAPQTSQHPSSVRRARSEAILQREHLRIFNVEMRQMDEEIRQKILTLLDQHRIMTIATLRPDGWPQATTVGYANDGLTLYFLCGPDSQKAVNLARDDRVSLTIDHDTPQVMDITGLSMAARATVVVDPTEGEKALGLLMRKYPPQDSLPLPMPTPADVRIFRVTPTVISVLDYSKGFGHTDLVTCEV
jgi:nitroimidazol reductase NimA-like FMN-containing flavoprotein (pyridoxamine 5'-phosphate oxidase superfamily)